MASKTEICNLALMLLNVEEVADVDTEETKEARTMKAIFPTVRDIVLARHPWNFAVCRRQIAKDATGPINEWTYAYSLPGGGTNPYCLRVLRIGEAADDIAFKVEGRKLLTNEPSPIYLSYIGRVEDPALFSPGFNDVFAYELAARSCRRLTGSTSLMVELRKEARDGWTAARFEDGAEGHADDFGASDYERARR